MKRGPVLFVNCHAATLVGPDPYGFIENAAILADEGAIRWIGERSLSPSAPECDLGGRLVTPALIDCHTHIVHAGHRAHEFEARLGGVRYEEIARAGGGILSTVTATRAASVEALVNAALPRVDSLLAEGVSTIEVKSGYGLDMDTELRMLRAARALAAVRPVEIRTSFLGAHAVPPEFSNRADAYIDDICLPALRAAAESALVDSVDGFCESIAFSRDQIARVFAEAARLGLRVRLHAEQLSNQRGAMLAAQYNALSADHLEYLDEDGARAMANAGTVATLLPGAYYALGETQAPPVALLRQLGIPMAVATDMNPGSSPLSSLLLAMNMACTLFHLTPEEALRGTTLNAARALGLDDRGALIPGRRADMAVWNVGHPAELAYRIGFNPLWKRIIGGAA